MFLLLKTLSNHKILNRCSVLLGLIISFNSFSVDYRTYIPPKAFDHKEIVKNEIDRIFPDIPEYNYFPALIEHESCVSLLFQKCWNSLSKLDTSRELGIGLTMITKAYDDQGNVRFDTLKDLRNKYMSELKEASWDNLSDRPDLQIRAGLLLLRDNWKGLSTIENDLSRLHMVDAAYNGGLGSVNNSRRACGLASGCDPQHWFDNTERYCTKSTKPIYSGRSACDIWINHPRDVFEIRLPKYIAQYILEEDFYVPEPEPEPEIIEVEENVEEVIEELPQEESTEQIKESKPSLLKKVKNFFKGLLRR